MKPIHHQREKQFKHQGGLCCWCMRPMLPPGLDPLAMSWEHVIPRSKGGSNARTNRVLAHRLCNRERGTQERTPLFAPYPAVSSRRKFLWQAVKPLMVSLAEADLQSYRAASSRTPRMDTTL